MFIRSMLDPGYGAHQLGLPLPVQRSDPQDLPLSKRKTDIVETVPVSQILHPENRLPRLPLKPGRKDVLQLPAHHHTDDVVFRNLF